MSNLDRCWKNCLRMWKWISENWKKGDDVEDLKRQWRRSHNFSRASLIGNADCFFCEYQQTHGKGHIVYRGGTVCENCPAVYVSKSFNCYATSYSFEAKPKAFYRKLLALNKQRKAL